MNCDMYPDEIRMNPAKGKLWLQDLSKESLHQIVNDKNLPIELMILLAENLPVKFLKNFIFHKKISKEVKLEVVNRIFQANQREINLDEKLKIFNLLLNLQNWEKDEKLVVRNLVLTTQAEIGSRLDDNIDMQKIIGYESKKAQKPTVNFKSNQESDGVFASNLEAQSQKGMLQEVSMNSKSDVMKSLACNPSTKDNARLKALEWIGHRPSKEISLVEKNKIAHEAISYIHDKQIRRAASRILYRIVQYQKTEAKRYYTKRTRTLLELDRGITHEAQLGVYRNLIALQDFLVKSFNADEYKLIHKILRVKRLNHKSDISTKSFRELNAQTYGGARKIHSISDWEKIDFQLGKIADEHPLYYVTLHSLRVVGGHSIDSIKSAIKKSNDIDRNFSYYLQIAQESKQSNIPSKDPIEDLQERERRSRNENRTEIIQELGLKNVGPGSFAVRWNRG